MNTDEFRIEADSMGEMRVPANAYYGAQTARAVENFPISGLRFPRPFIRTLGLIKKHAARTNFTLGFLTEDVAWAIQKAAQEVADGKWDGQFVVDIFQTGSGTSTNMNANEVIANRAIEILGGERGSKSIHPNNHVNRGQSSNDVIPTAIHIAALDEIAHRLSPALQELHSALVAKAREFENIFKIGRTHLQDATPVRLGQEFSGYASQIEQSMERLRGVREHLGALALGGTAVGTGINTHPDFARRTIEGLSAELGISLWETRNHFAAQGSIDVLVEASNALKTLAISLIKIANDIRWLGSGPRCGLGELKLPATQPGSSIMPGKVNPVMCEMLIQAGAQVIGNDAVVTFAGTFGNFELNTMLPVTAHNLLQSIHLLRNASRIFTEKCLHGLDANREKCESNLEQSLALCTALVPVIGYDAAANIAKVAFQTNRTIREAAEALSGIEPAKLQEFLNPERQAGK
ncbi:MAG TPA: class II fumarate hydratase [Candidatus Paceibacterota bacterium]|nr:class II fumarate hydratase [Candidatus Paceibacterota bacterium]